MADPAYLNLGVLARGEQHDTTCASSSPRWSGSWFRFMKEQYTPFILSTKGKALVLVGSACIFAAGVYGVTQVGFCRESAKRF